MSRLGFKKRRDKILGRGYEVDRELLRKLAVIYRVEPPEITINHPEINGLFGTRRNSGELRRNEAILVTINFGTTRIL